MKPFAHLARPLAGLIGTAALADPKLPGRIVKDLQRWMERERISDPKELVGALKG